MSYLLNYKGWKTLHESQRLFESSYASLDLSKLVLSDADKNEIDESVYNKFLQLFKDYGVIFSVDQETAASIIAAKTDFVSMKSINTGNLIKVMQSPKSPNDPKKILTTGNWTPSGINQPDDVSGESEYSDIIKYLNNNFLYNIVTDQDWVNYLISRDTNGSLKIGAVNQEVAAYLYSTAEPIPAQSNQTVAQTTWTIPEQGKIIEKKLPGSMFVTGQITLSDSTELDKAIAELTALTQDKNTKITSIIIESSASGDRGVGGKSGYPSEADVAANKYPLGTPYLPKSAEESGNSKLAFGRAETVKAKLGNLAPITVKAMIQNGGDAAQYAKIIANVEKVDKPAQQFTKSELNNLLLKKAGQNSYAEVQQIRRFKLFDAKYGK